jgi:hypothetical protein
MAYLFKSAATIAMAFGFAGAPAWAASSASSAASDSITTLSGSVSTSLGKSSDSSKGGDKSAAAGDYKIIEVAQAAHPNAAQPSAAQPNAAHPAAPDAVAADTMRLKLQAVADSSADGEFYLYLPRAALAQSRLNTGHIVTVTPRPYGIEFANTSSREAFFLVLQDDWYRELQTKALTL